VEGDYNADGSVDAADYVLWRKNNINGQPGYDAWRANFGSTGGSGAELIGNFYVGYREVLGGAFATARPPTFVQYQAAPGGLAAAVPEPTGVALTMLGLLIIAAGSRVGR
jgi:hypothetical protein